MNLGETDYARNILVKFFRRNGFKTYIPKPNESNESVSNDNWMIRNRTYRVLRVGGVLEAEGLDADEAAKAALRSLETGTNARSYYSFPGGPMLPSGTKTMALVVETSTLGTISCKEV